MSPVEGLGFPNVMFRLSMHLVRAADRRFSLFFFPLQTQKTVEVVLHFICMGCNSGIVYYYYLFCRTAVLGLSVAICCVKC